MQFTIDAAVLQQALQSSKPGQFSASAYVLIQAHADTVTLTTSNEELRLTVRIAETVCLEAEGEFALPYHPLVRIVESFEGRISLRRNGEVMMVSAKGERLRQTPLLGKEISPFPGFSPLLQSGETYTRIEWVDHTCSACGHPSASQITSTYRITEGTSIQRVSLARTTLEAMCKRVAWAAQDVDGQHPAFNGIQMELGEASFKLIASNVFCLAICRRTTEGAENWPQNVLVNATLLKRAIRMLPQKSIVLVEAFLTERQHIRRGEQNLADAEPFQHATALRLTAENVEVMLALMPETFPAYQSVLKHAYETRAVFKTAALLPLIKGIAPIAKEYDQTVQLALGASLQAKTGYEPQVAVHEAVVEQKSGEDQQVLLDASYLRQALQAIQMPQVVLDVAETSLMNMGSPERGKMVTVWAEEAHEGYRCTMACKKTPMPPEPAEANV